MIYLFTNKFNSILLKIGLFYISTEWKLIHKRAAARNAGGAQPRCYLTRRHDLQNAPGVVVRACARSFETPNSAIGKNYNTWERG